MAIHWTKQDVINRVKEAMTPEQPKPGQGGNALQNLLSKIKRKPSEGQVNE